MARSGKHSLIVTLEALRERCIVDEVTRCWKWTGGASSDGTPRLHTFNHETGSKQTMSGPKAVWNIAHGEAPRRGWFVMRSCGNRACMNPVHMAQFRSRVEMGEHIRLAGWRKGTHVEARRAAQRLACVAAGCPPTPEHVVREILALADSMTQTALAERYGLARQTVSRIVRRESHRHIVGATA